MVIRPHVVWTYTGGPRVSIPDVCVIVPSLSSSPISRVQVYGRRLTALILGSHTAQHRRESGSFGAIEARAYISQDDREDYDADDDVDEGGDSAKLNGDAIPFGDNRQARLVSVKCHKPKK